MAAKTSKKIAVNKPVVITEEDWLNHFSRSAINLQSREAVTKSNKALAVERVEMVREYEGNHALLVEHLSLSMAVFTGTKASKQSLKRSLGLATEKATDNMYSLHFSGDNCTVVAAKVKAVKDTLSEAWDTLGETVPAHVIDNMKAIHAAAALQLREATAELRRKAEATEQVEKVGRARAMLERAGRKITDDAVETLVACM